MSSDDLSQQITLLVDNLRKQDTSKFSLTDVASVTEVLIGTTNKFFQSIDTSIYRECRALSDYISDARKEIAALQPGDLESTRIPRAGLELDAIVQQTEEATNTIMEAAEAIMEADPADTAKYHTITQDAVMRIFEACSFQDITGQRITKVVETLAHIEQRVVELRNLLGVTEEDIDDARADAGDIPADKALLSGPALKGEGIDQSEVDSLMSGFDAVPAEEPKAAAPPPPPPPPAAPPKPPAPKAVHPKKLDNMFEEDFDPVAEAEKKEAEKKAVEEKAAKAAEAKKTAAAAPAAKPVGDPSSGDELTPGEEVSQDDIDALFG
ncbi:MAG: hypothetical protein COB37_06740 [Kordiimonadales bacterium]|nr:MAG: hypothetical protein COB37_06740 [Kordiimonadales bacterium]